MPSLVKTNTVLLQFRILLGVCVVVAHLTLTQVVQVRFLYPLPNKNTLGLAQAIVGIVPSEPRT